jgi:hypothetical protein
MNAIQFVSKKFSIFNLRYAHCIAIFVLVALATISIAGSLTAEERFALIGSWENTGRATLEIPAWTTTIVFKPDGTFTRKFTVLPTPAQRQRDMAPGEENWRGTYRPTGTSSWVATVQSYKRCEKKTGSCNSCPKQRGDGRGYKNACVDTKKAGLPVGVPKKNIVQMQGPDTFVTDAGDTFHRVR